MQQLTVEPAALLLPRKQSHATVQPPSRPPITRSSNSPTFLSFNLRNTFAIVIIPLGALLCVPWVPLKNRTLLFGVFYAYLRSFAIVTGRFLYHLDNTRIHAFDCSFSPDKYMNRLPSSLGTQDIHRQHSLEIHICTSRCRCRARPYQKMGPRPPCSPPLR